MQIGNASQKVSAKPHASTREMLAYRRTMTSMPRSPRFMGLLSANDTGRSQLLLEKLSPQARKLLSKRATRLSLELPAPEGLRDTTQQKACDIVLKLCQYGGSYDEGRRRRWHPLLSAPKLSKNFPRRDAERDFVMWLQVAWLAATDKRPSLAANPKRPGPFARMVRKSLELIGAGHADAVGLINELNRRRRIQKRPVTHQN